MFCVPWSLRDQSAPCSPCGPRFARAPVYSFCVDGTHIAIKAPRHRAGSYHDTISPRRNYSTDGNDPQRVHWKDMSGGDDRWKFSPIIYRVWDFYGPMFVGRLGSVYLSTYVARKNALPADVSLFHPRALEFVLADMLKYLYFDESDLDYGTQRWRAPVSWRPLRGELAGGVRFDVMPHGGYNPGKMYRQQIMPISNEHLLAVALRFTRNIVFCEDDEGNSPHVDDWIDITPMLALADQVLDSVRVELSEAAGAQRRQALEGLADASLVSDFPPLMWDDEEAAKGAETVSLPAEESS